MLLKKVINYGRQKGFKALKIKLGERIKYKKETDFYMKNHKYDEDVLNLQRIEKFEKQIKISICVPVYNTEKKMLVEMLKSVLAQTYSNWELCIADGSSKEFGYIESIVRGINDNRIKYNRLRKNFGIVENSNISCAMASGEFIALLDHDDILAPDALYEVRRAIDKGADYIYSDEASFSKNYLKPDIIHFKDEFSFLNLRGNNFICHLSVFKKDLFEEVGGFRSGFEGSQDHDLILRICEKAKNIYHIPKVLYFWRVHKNSVASDISAKPYCLVAGQKAVKSHLDRMKIKASVELAVENASVYKVNYSNFIKPVIINNIENIKGVTNEYIIVAKPDLSFSVEAINELCQIIQLKNIGMVGGAVIKDGKIEYATLREENGEVYSEYEGIDERSDGYMKRLKYVQRADYLPYQFFATRKSILENMLYFEENLWEDDKVFDMCKRMRKIGYEIAFNPFARAYRK